MLLKLFWKVPGCENDFRNPGLNAGFDDEVDDRFISEVNKRLGDSESERSQSRAKPSDHDDCFHELDKKVKQLSKNGFLKPVITDLHTTLGFNGICNSNFKKKITFV